MTNRFEELSPICFLFPGVWDHSVAIVELVHLEDVHASCNRCLRDFDKISGAARLPQTGVDWHPSSGLVDADLVDAAQLLRAEDVRLAGAPACKVETLSGGN